MTKNEMIKVATSNFPRYVVSNRSLFDVYNKPSVTKKSIWGDLQRECADRDGESLRVISYNCMIFTAGYIFPDPDTGVLMFKYIAPTWSVVIEMPWLS